MMARSDGASSRGGFSTRSRHLIDAVAQRGGRLDGNHAVARDLVARHALHREDRALHAREHVDELFDRRRIRIDHIVAQDHRERLVADQLARDEHRVAEAERLALADVREINQIGDLPHFGELLPLAARLEKRFELDRHVEMILDGVLAAPRDQNDVVDAGGDGLFDAVLNDRLVDERQHLLGLRLGGRQKPRARVRRRGRRLCARRLARRHRSRGLRGDANIEWIAEVACSILHSYATTSKRCGPVSGTAASIDVDKSLEEIATLETARRRLIPEIEGLKRLQNTSGDEVARAKRMGKDTSDIQDANRAGKQQIKQLSVQLDSVEHQRDRALLMLPNLPHATVPVGKSAADNVEVRRHGQPRTFDFEPKAHWDLGAGARHHRLRAGRRGSPGRASRC